MWTGWPSWFSTGSAWTASRLSARTGAAWHALRGYERPFLCAFSDSDPITRGGEAMFIGHVPGTAGQPHTTIEGAGHFLQEDKGEQLARLITDFIAAT